MYKLLILLSISLIGFGCNSNQSSSVPDNFELDVEQDGDSDFQIVYLQQTSGDPIGNYKEIKMQLESSGNNEILKNEDEFPIFLTNKDLIQTQVALPLFWEITNPASNISTPIATIRTDYDEMTWNEKWSVFSKEEKETYFMGFKLLENNISEIGYIEFSIDLETGQFVLLNTEFL